MIGALIVIGSIAFAAALAVAWWRRPALRRAIEAPKHEFAERVRRYDDAYRASGGLGAPTDPHE